MKLRLKHSQSVLPSSAAFLRGGEPMLWLVEIDSWGVSPKELECYAVPVSRNSVEVAGLFVVFKSPKAAETLHLIDAYAAIAGRLYIPIHSQLYPQAHDNELTEALSYKRQLLHPSIGLVGFAKEDELDLSTLLHSPKGKKTPWDRAAPPPPHAPSLQRITLELPPPEILIESLKDGVDRKPLKDIPKDKDEKQQNPWDDLKSRLLKGGQDMSRNLRDALSSEHGTRKPPEWWDKIDRWMARKRGDLQKKRDDEISRLLKLFEENPDEALRYALPLDSPYAGRGTAPPSDSLGRKSTNFNLGGLGGGRAVDGWNLGNRYFDLRAKYQRTAEELTRKGDYRRAAYVYAHLLGDFSAAANVLKQGKHFAEAAALYRKHLKNEAAAAECLELGGLLFEAIELYEKLGRHEKVGDLYTLMEQQDKAIDCYEKVVDVALSNRDFPDAARVLSKKLGETDRAEETLLKGWDESSQPESCLRLYFDLPREQGALLEDLKKVFQRHTPPRKQTMFLNTLLHITDKHAEEGLLEESREIAYQIISSQAEQGDTSNISKLHRFIPGDRLIAGDTSRYLNLHRDSRPKSPRTKQYEMIQFFPLYQDIDWIGATMRQGKHLAFGIKNGQLQVVRWDASQNREYHSIAAPIRANEYFHVPISPAHSGKIFVYASHLSFVAKELPRNSHFQQSMSVEAPAWLPNNNLIGFVQDRENQLTAFVAQNAKLEMQQFNLLSGELLWTTSVLDEEKDSRIILANQQLTRVLYRHKHFFMAGGPLFMRISRTGQLNQVKLHGNALQIAATGEHTALRLAVSTENGCCLFRPNQKGLNQVGSTFAHRLGGKHLLFVGHHLLVGDADEVEVYDTQGSDTPRLLGGFEVKNGILELLSGPKRGQATVVTHGGTVRVYAL